MISLAALESGLRTGLRLGAMLALTSGLSSCIVTTLVVAGYYETAGVGDHEARVADAWRGPQGELALALEELEGAFGTKESVLVITADELEQMFVGQVPAPPLLSVPHVRLPRAILFRERVGRRPEPGDPARVPVAEWEVRTVETEGVKRYAPPDSLAGEPLAVHWTHRYRTGIPGETGFVLLLTRSTPEGIQRALLLPEQFRQPAWTSVLVVLAIAVDVTWITLLLA
jgi:hypothetical protein